MKDKIKFGRYVGPNKRQALVQRADGSFEYGTAEVAEDGRTIPEGSDYIEAAECEYDGWHEMTTIFRNERPAASGPPQVATDEYRKGYDRIFGKQKVGLA